MQSTQVSASDGIKQTIAPLDGRRETRWCLLTLGIILLLGALGVRMNQAPVPERRQHLSLSVEDKAMLLSLSNAITEIRFLQQADGDWPSIESLNEQQIPPFDQLKANTERQSIYQWSTPQAGCYLALSQQAALSSFMLLIPESEQVAGEIYSHSGPVADSPCHTDSPWQLQSKEF